MATFGRIVADTLWGACFLAHLSFPSLGSGFRSRIGPCKHKFSKKCVMSTHRLVPVRAQVQQRWCVSALAIIAESALNQCEP